MLLWLLWERNRSVWTIQTHKLYTSLTHTHCQSDKHSCTHTHKTQANTHTLFSSQTHKQQHKLRTDSWNLHSLILLHFRNTHRHVLTHTCTHTNFCELTFTYTHHQTFSILTYTSVTLAGDCCCREKKKKKYIQISTTPHVGYKTIWLTQPQ